MCLWKWLKFFFYFLVVWFALVFLACKIFILGSFDSAVFCVFHQYCFIIVHCILCIISTAVSVFCMYCEDEMFMFYLFASPCGILYFLIVHKNPPVGIYLYSCTFSPSLSVLLFLLYSSFIFLTIFYDYDIHKNKNRMRPLHSLCSLHLYSLCLYVFMSTA